jgi:hypothetical protein
MAILLVLTGVVDYPLFIIGTRVALDFVQTLPPKKPAAKHARATRKRK